LISWSEKIDGLQTLYTSQTIADVIKANANPNLHLNEINPNASIWGWVDKTDLIRNSTEFCFIPTGVFEIESQGLVLRPKEGFDSLTSSNIVKGRRKIIAEVKLYDIYRETTQQDFYRGDFGNYTTLTYPTNNMRPLESGPEPDQGLAPFENNYEGYVILSTQGGSGVVKGKGLVIWTETDEDCDARLDSRMHAHYDLDFRLHHTTSGRTRPFTELPEVNGKSLTFWCKQDKTESNPDFTSPYCLAYDKRRYRIARCYTSAGGPPEVSPYAPLDHRIDGVYCERHALLPYLSENVINLENGTISFWMKPGFFPEYNSLPRTFVDMTSDFYDNFFSCFYVWMEMMIESSEYNYGGLEYRGVPSEIHYSVYRLRPVSLGFGCTGQESIIENNIEYPYLFLSTTPTLNHNGHQYLQDHRDPANYNLFEAHKWINVSFMWGKEGATKLQGYYGSFRTDKSTQRSIYAKIWINGTVLDREYYTYFRYDIWKR
jgi:hypothetical protein